MRQLKGISCHSHVWVEGGKITSCSDAIAKSLEKYLTKAGNGNGDGHKDHEEAMFIGRCPECGGAVEYSEGCAKCHGCGFTKCGYGVNDEDIERIIHYFKDRNEVSALYIFGSFGRDKKTRESDIDIAVLIDESKLQKKNFELLKRKYYTASPAFSLRPVDIVILNTAAPFLKHQVLKTGRILFDRNRKLRVRFTERAITEYLDYKPIEDIYLKAVASRFREKRIGR
jgi:predicted nucleotidyltransferase